MSRYQESDALLERALKSIPLGSQTFSKSITSFPKGVSPLFIKKANGSRVWDQDGNEYVDFMNALCSVTIGYNIPEVNAAVSAQLENGVTFSLPHELETIVAEKIIKMVPSAEMVRFGKNGTDATSAAIRLARAYTGKEKIAVCGYHGWQDWYIGSTTRNLGVPQSTRDLTHKFTYNDIESLEKIFIDNNNQVAAVILEPMNVFFPEDNFLENVKELTHKNGAVLVFDETITGFRYAKGGAQEYFGVTPDLTTLGKGLANGFPLSAITGKKEIMKLMEDIFFSGTFGGETLSLAAANVVLDKIANEDIIEKISSTGEKVFSEVQKLIERHQVENIFALKGHPSWSFLTISPINGYVPSQIKTLFLQELFKRGVLNLGTHNISAAHTDKDLETLFKAYDEIFPIIKKNVEDKTLKEALSCDELVPLFQVR